MSKKNNKNINIIIDTDPGTDDALMLGVASVFFKDNIRALVSSYGNVGGDRTYKNMIDLAGVLDIDCEFIKGSMYPLGKNSFVSTDYHGEDGLCGVEIVPVGAGFSRPRTEINKINVSRTQTGIPRTQTGIPRTQTGVNHGREDPAPTKDDFTQTLYDIIKKYGGVKYIATGPLTNFAVLAERFPDVINHIDELIIMGGGFDTWNVFDKNAEYNFSCDPEAVRKVLACCDYLKITLAPLDMTHKLAFSLDEIGDMTGRKRKPPPSADGTPFQKGAGDILAELFYLNYETAIKNNEEGAIIHDAATLAYLLDESKCEINKYKISADEYGAVRKDQAGYSINVIDDINRDFVKDIFREMFKFNR